MPTLQVLEVPIILGDVPGHPFRGNQYADGAESGADVSAPAAPAALAEPIGLLHPCK